MRVKLLGIALLAMGMMTAGAQVTPPRVTAYVWDGAKFAAWSAGSGMQAVAQAPPAVALYCYSGGQYTPCQPGTGSVTSVGLTAPSWFAVGGSPVTGAGTLALSAATGQTSHQVIGTCGSATSFGPCALVTADLPAGTGTVTTFSAGNLSPLFTTSVSTAGSTPALSFALTDAAANTIFGNFTGSAGAPSYNAVSGCNAAGSALKWVSGTGFGCNSAIDAATLGGKGLAGAGAGVTTGPTSVTGLDIPTFASSVDGRIGDPGIAQLATFGSGGGISTLIKFPATVPTWLGDVAGNQGLLCQNTHFNGTNWVYDTTNTASCLRLIVPSGVVSLHLVGSGSAGSTITTMDTTATVWSCAVGGCIFNPGSPTPTFVSNKVLAANSGSTWWVDTSGNTLAASQLLTGATPSAAAGQIGLGVTFNATIANCGGATVAATKCLTINDGGTTRYIPVY